MFDVRPIQWLQSLASPILDSFFILLTNVGSHYAYMLILPFIYWVVDRQVGRRLAGLFMASMWLNGLFKEYLTLPRPDATAVRVLVDEPSPGFPSGHAQGAITLWGYLAVTMRRRWLAIVALAFIGLIPVSRLYLGVHFAADVLGGMAIGAVLILGFTWCTARGIGANMSLRWRMIWTVVIPLLLYPLYQTGTSEQLIGFFIGFFTADRLAGQVVPYRERVPLGQQVAKLIIGYVGFAVLVVLHMLFVPVGLPGVFGYSLIGLWIAFGAPATFRKLGLDGTEPAPKPLVDQTLLRRYLTVAAVVFVLVVGSTVYVRQAVPVAQQPSRFQKDGVLIIGHRGGAGLAPENTLVAFETGLRNGVDVLEMDVWRSKDGHVVLMHDDTVNRTTNGSGRVADMTLSELQALDAGYHFTSDSGLTYPWRGQGVTVPTLEQVLMEFPHVPLMIEIKDPRPGGAEAVLAVIDRAGARDRVILGSFHDAVIRQVRGLAPHISTGLSPDEVSRLVVLQRLGLAAFARPAADSLQLPEWQGRLRVTNPGLARLARRQGLHLHVWTVNQPDDMHRLISLGANGIITDYPDRLQRVVSMLEGRNMDQVFY